MDLTEVLDYAQWAKDIIKLNSQAHLAQKRTLSRGQVYWCSLGMGVGSEERKKRPCVIISTNSINIGSPNVIVAPITHSKTNVKTSFEIEKHYDSNGVLILDGYVLLANTVCVSKARLGDYIDTLSKDDMSKLNYSLMIAVGVYPLYIKKANELADKLSYIEKLKSKLIDLTNENSEQKKKLEKL